MAERSKTIRRDNARTFRGPLTAALALFMGVLAGCGGPTTVDLSLALEAGKSYQIVEETDLVTDLNGMATIQERAEMARTLTIDSIQADGSAQATLTIDRVRHDLIGLPPGMKLPVSEMIEGGKGLTYTFTLAPDGTVTGVTPPANLVAHVRESVTSIPSELSGFINSMAEDTFGANAIENNLELTLAIFPEEPVDTGSTWTMTKKWQYGPESFDVNQTYTVTARENGLMTLEVVSDVASSSGMTGSITETMVVNEATGWPNSGKATLELKGSWPFGQETIQSTNTGRTETNIY